MTFEKYSYYKDELCSNPMNQSSFLESSSVHKHEEEPDSDSEKHSETSNDTPKDIHKEHTLKDIHEEVNEKDIHKEVNEKDIHEKVNEEEEEEEEEKEKEKEEEEEEKEEEEEEKEEEEEEEEKEEEEVDLSERHLVNTFPTENQKDTTRFPQGHQVFYVAQDVENFKQESNSNHRIEKRNYGQSQPFTVQPSHPDLPYFTPLSIPPQQYQTTTNFHTTYPPDVTGYSIKHVASQNPYPKYPTPWPYQYIEREPVFPCVVPPWGSYRGTPPTHNPHYVPYTKTHFLHYRQPPSSPVLPNGNSTLPHEFQESFCDIKKNPIQDTITAGRNNDKVLSYLVPKHPEKFVHKGNRYVMYSRQRPSPHFRRVSGNEPPTQEAPVMDEPASAWRKPFFSYVEQHLGKNLDEIFPWILKFFKSCCLVETVYPASHQHTFPPHASNQFRIERVCLHCGEVLDMKPMLSHSLPYSNKDVSNESTTEEHTKPREKPTFEGYEDWNINCSIPSEPLPKISLPRFDLAPPRCFNNFPQHNWAERKYLPKSSHQEFEADENGRIKLPTFA